MDTDSEKWYIVYNSMLTPLEGLTGVSMETTQLRIAALTNYVKIHKHITSILIGKLNLIYVPEMFKFPLELACNEEYV